MAASLGGLGGLPIPADFDLSKVQDSIKGITAFVEENPIAAAAVALGAGVMLTSLYWDKNKG